MIAAPVFVLRCRLIGWVDADTVEVRWLALNAGNNWRVRLKDRYSVEPRADPAEHARLLALAKAEIGDAGDVVVLTNTRHHRTFERIEARVDSLETYTTQEVTSMAARKSKTPVASVGAAGLGAIALVAFTDMLAGLGATDFAGLVALLGAGVVFLFGYLPARFKSLATAAGAFVAVLLALFIGPLLGYEVDVALVSTAFVAFAQAAIQYALRNTQPDAPAAPVAVVESEGRRRTD